MQEKVKKKFLFYETWLWDADCKAIWKLKSQFMFCVCVFHINVDHFLNP